jgi:hypothetical protein
METSNTTAQVTMKVQYKDDLRRCSFPRNGSFLDLEKTLKNVFSFAPSCALVLKYQDDEMEWVTCSSDVELASAFDFVSPNGILKVLISSEVPSPAKSVPVSDVNVAEPAGLAPRVDSAPSDRPWKAWRKEKKLWKQEKKEEKKCHWRNWTPEERAAWIEKRQAWKNMFKLQKEKIKDEHKNRKCRKMGKCDRSKCKKLRGEEAPAPGHHLARRSGCPKFRAHFVKHVTVPDGSLFGPGTPFTKTWRFRNGSKASWPVGSKLLFVGKKKCIKMGGPDEVAVGRAVEPGQEVDISVPLVSPHFPGSYRGCWRMADPNGRRFGRRVRVQVQVPGEKPSGEGKKEGATHPSECGSREERRKYLAESSCCGPELFGQLQAMGFQDKALYMHLAKKYDGDALKIVRKLMKRHRKIKAAWRSASH